VRDTGIELVPSSDSHEGPGLREWDLAAVMPTLLPDVKRKLTAGIRVWLAHE
jgi:hypothetical protein